MLKVLPRPRDIPADHPRIVAGLIQDFANATHRMFDGNEPSAETCFVFSQITGCVNGREILEHLYGVCE